MVDTSVRVLRHELTSLWCDQFVVCTFHCFGISEMTIPWSPVDLGYRIIPSDLHSRLQGPGYTKTKQVQPVFPVEMSTRRRERPGFDAIIFWKPHPEMVVGGGSRANRSFSPGAGSTGGHFGPASHQQVRGYRIVWGPRLVEPIEPDMYSNGIAPQFDPDRTESKVVDSVSAGRNYLTALLCVLQYYGLLHKTECSSYTRILAPY